MHHVLYNTLLSGIVIIKNVSSYLIHAYMPMHTRINPHYFMMNTPVPILVVDNLYLTCFFVCFHPIMSRRILDGDRPV